MSVRYDKLDYKYSVLMPVYFKDNAEWLKISIDSMLSQTVSADEFIIVKDGKVTEELDNILDSYDKKYPNLFKIYEMKENVGLGKVLKYGVEVCRNEFIARMDADDYSKTDRCEKQLEVFRLNNNYSVVGSNVEEFFDDSNNVISQVLLPEKHEDIYKYAKKRCPIRHPALMYKRSHVINSGNYSDYFHAQDYNLVVKMLMNNCIFYNIQESLTLMRVTSDFYKRRGALRQLKIVYKLKKEFWEMGFYTFNNFFISTSINSIVCLLPNFIRELIYKKFLRA